MARVHYHPLGMTANGKLAHTTLELKHGNKRDLPKNMCTRPHILNLVVVMCKNHVFEPLMDVIDAGQNCCT